MKFSTYIMAPFKNGKTECPTVDFCLRIALQTKNPLH